MKFDQILKFSIIFINFFRAHNKLPTIDKQEVLYMKARAEILEDSAHKTTDIHESGFETFIKPHDYLEFEDLFFFLYLYSFPFIQIKTKQILCFQFCLRSLLFKISMFDFHYQTNYLLIYLSTPVPESVLAIRGVQLCTAFLRT